MKPAVVIEAPRRRRQVVRVTVLERVVTAAQVRAAAKARAVAEMDDGRM